MAEAPVTHERLREVLDYDHETGVFRWKMVPNNRVLVGQIAGSLRPPGQYRYIGIDGQVYGASRLAWLYMTGAWPSEIMDHLNGVHDDNRFANLRDVSPAGNAQNRRRADKDNSSGLLGVSRFREKFKAQINAGNGRIVYLGLFATAERAHAVYVEAKRKLHGGCTL